MTVAAPSRPLLLEEVVVASVARLSSSFVRLELAGPGLAELGVDGPFLDQRIKLLLPAGETPRRPVTDLGADWYAEWRAWPEDERGHLRTYTIREVRGTGAETRLVVDVVVHEHTATTPQGPGCRWALAARPGDVVGLIAPRRGHPFGGIEFLPPGGLGALSATPALLVGDETALPAIAAVLADLPDDARGHAIIEVPHRDDVQVLVAPVGVEVLWLAREGGARGAALQSAVLALLGLDGEAVEVSAEEVDPDLWETPGYSSSGEVTASSAAEDRAADQPYVWIAGESRVVTGLRRLLVREHGLPRTRVAFMGYWREGVAVAG